MLGGSLDSFASSSFVTTPATAAYTTKTDQFSLNKFESAFSPECCHCPALLSPQLSGWKMFIRLCAPNKLFATNTGVHYDIQARPICSIFALRISGRLQQPSGSKISSRGTQDPSHAQEESKFKKDVFLTKPLHEVFSLSTSRLTNRTRAIPSPLPSNAPPSLPTLSFIPITTLPS